MGEQYPRLQIEANHYGKVMGISAPTVAKHDLDFVCELSSASAAERIVALWNALRGIDDPAAYVARVERLISSSKIAHNFLIPAGYDGIARVLESALDALDATSKHD